MSEYIRHTENGLLSYIDDINGLAKNLQAVLEDADLRERLIAGGAKTYEAKFSRELAIDSLLKVYEEIIRRGVLNNHRSIDDISPIKSKILRREPPFD